MGDQTLFERLGGAFPIAAVIDHFSDRLLENRKVVDANPVLKEWHTQQYRERLPGLKFLRTLWVCAVAFHSPPEIFDVFACVLSRSLDLFKVPVREKEEVLAAFAAHKADVTAGAMTAVTR
jgi:hemoglobin